MRELAGAPTYQTSLEAAARYIREHDRFLVVSHLQPDGDAASSTCAVGWLLEQCGKDFIMVNEDAIPSKFDYLYGFKQITSVKEQRPAERYRHIICIDCADFKRVGVVAECFEEGCELLNIDHHPTNDRYGTVNLIKDDAAATVELLYDLVTLMNIPWTKEAAECIYTGLLTDTGGFRYSSTSPKVMNIAAELLTHGVQGAELAEHLLETISYPHIQLLKRALASLEFSEDRRIAWMQVSNDDLQATGAGSDDMEGLVNYPRNIEGVAVGILFKQAEGEDIKISLRSGGEADVSRIAQEFGGGGHIRAAGATLQGTMNDVVDRVIESVKAALS